MASRAKIWLLSSVAAVTLAGGGAVGQETTTYNYDALGRLSGSSISGGPNNTRKTGTCFDPAGNRTRYDVATSAPGACPTPTPTPTQTSSNQPPVANDDTVSLQCNATTTMNLVANDTDPENNLPLSLVSIAFASGGDASASVTSSTSVSITGDMRRSTTEFSYVVQDSLGAQSTGSLTVNSIGPLGTVCA